MLAMRTPKVASMRETRGAADAPRALALACLLVVAGAASTPALAQTGIFSIFRPQPQQDDDPASPYADAQDDHASWVATGAPLMLRPSEDLIRRAPRAVELPLPPRRPDGLGAPAEPPPQQQAARTPTPASPAPAAPTTVAPAPAPEPTMEEPEPPSTGDAPAIRSFAALPPSFNRPLATLAPPPVPEKVTPEQLEQEERAAPEPQYVEKQTDYVNIRCLKPELMAVIERAGAHFKGTPVITSGQRSSGRRGSYHRMCMAADFFIPGIDRSSLAGWLRRQPDAGGVGTYCHTKSVHIDIGDPRNWWQCGRRFSFALRG
jgi:hypothetical protein